MKPYNLLILIVLLLVTGCRQSFRTGSDRDQIRSSRNQLTVSGKRFIDSFGRQVILSGVNKVNKSRDMNYFDDDSLGSYGELANMGFNVIRLGVIWDGVEPEPGRYDEKYLDKLEQRIKWAAENGIYVMLDMHQDLFSVLYSDGAPVWATLSEEQPHFKGPIWSDAYFISPAVQKAFDNFWSNKPASDGIGIQDHYSNMWRHIAARFAGNKAIVGYDIMNEPFNGTQGTLILPVILASYAGLFAEETGKILSRDELMEIWADEDKRSEAISRMNSAEKYSRIIDSATVLTQQFDRSTLQPMYQKISDAIREVDSTHILFLEHSYFCNTGILSGIEPVKDKNGVRDPLVAYAPHGYDLLLDTKNYDAQSNDRVELIFSRLQKTSERMNVPVLVGEWGAFSGNSVPMTSNAAFIIRQIEKFGYSNTYWAYYNGIESEHYFRNAIIRPYPQFTGGLLNSYGFDKDKGLFSCSWEERPEVNAPTVIYIPDLELLIRNSISLSPERSSTVIQTLPNSRAGYLVIPVTGKSITRSIEFRLTGSHNSIAIPGKNSN